MFEDQQAALLFLNPQTKCGKTDSEAGRIDELLTDVEAYLTDPNQFFRKYSLKDLLKEYSNLIDLSLKDESGRMFMRKKRLKGLFIKLNINPENSSYYS